MTDLTDLSLTRQAELIATGEVDAGELLQATLERMIALDDRLNCVCARFDAEAERMLAQAPPGPLHGVPVTVKDMFSLPWYAPGDGSDHPRAAKASSAVFRRLRDAGAVVVAATNMHLYGAGTTGAVSAHGPARNPWDPARCAGGSSGGAAAGVAARIVAAAVGTDAGGSIRIPAAYCGITGLKPTFGKVAVDGYTHGYSTMGAVGPLARDAADTRLLANALYGEELLCETAPPLRAGIVGSPFWDDLDPEVGDACSEVLAAAGWQLSELELEGAQHALIASVLRLSLESLPELSGTELADADPLARAVFKYQLTLPARFLVRADRVRSLLRRSLMQAFAHCDVLVWPTVKAPAPAVDDTMVDLPSGRSPADPANVCQTGLANLCGIPAISVPVGLHSGSGLPIALSLHAPWGRDDLLLNAASHIETVTQRSYVEAVAPV